ncbi:MAG: hypothetical protein RQ715_05160 [Methylococcales bacterium]|nr:hypothetical protein [Methylococcales bacterium]
MLKVLGTLVEWLQATEQRGLRRTFAVWIRRVLLPNRTPGMAFPELNDLQDLHEVHDMLAERIKKWPELWEQRGIQTGIQQGEQVGIQKGRMTAMHDTARNLIARTEMDDTLIAEISGLPAEAVAALRSETRRCN